MTTRTQNRARRWGFAFLLVASTGLACTGDFTVYPAPSTAWDDGRASNTPGDRDRDGLTDWDEDLYGTHRDDPDSDRDGLLDGEEVELHFTDPTSADSDADALLDGDELFVFGTDPLDADTDRDGLLDEEEVALFFTDPLDVDTDDDGWSDGREVELGSDPRRAF